MSIKQKRELWLQLILSTIGPVSSEESRGLTSLYKNKSESMTEAELDKDIADLQAGAEQLGIQV